MESYTSQEAPNIERPQFLIDNEKTLTEFCRTIPPDSYAILGGTAVDLKINVGPTTNTTLSRKHGDFDIVAKPESRGAIITSLSKQSTILEEAGNKLIISLPDETEAHIVFLQKESDGYSTLFYGNKIFLPENTFQGTPLYVQGQRVSVAPPDVLMQTLNINRAVGMEMRGKDMKSLQLIQRRYFPDTPIDASEFIPKVERPTHTQ